VNRVPEVNFEDKPPPAPSLWPLVVAVLVSAAVLAGSAWIRGGVEATSYDEVDSVGRPMGFNDVFSAEHYVMLLRNADVANVVEQMNSGNWWQHWGLLVAHGVLLWLIATGTRRTVRWFLLAQLVIFYWGWVGFWFLPIEVADLFWMHSNDREGFVDLPYIAIMSQGAWFWVCALVWWQVRRVGRMRVLIGLAG
jgi:hypothetical protein